jgi:hypothetical protein
MAQQLAGAAGRSRRRPIVLAAWRAAGARRGGAAEWEGRLAALSPARADVRARHGGRRPLGWREALHRLQGEGRGERAGAISHPDLGDIAASRLYDVCPK